jgi:hypothetical protein
MRSISKSLGVSPAISRPPRTLGPPPAATIIPLSNTPTPEVRSHHDIEAPRVDERHFRPSWRVRTRLAGLYENERISPAALSAGLAWRGWAERIGRMRASSFAVRVSRGLLPDTPNPPQAIAAAQLQASAVALGPARTRLLFWHLVDDLSWRQLGAKLHLDGKTALVRTVESLEALAAWRAGKPVPKPPSERFRNQPSSW